MKELIIENEFFMILTFLHYILRIKKEKVYKVNTCKTKTFENLFVLSFFLSLLPPPTLLITSGLQFELNLNVSNCLFSRGKGLIKMIIL